MKSKGQKLLVTAGPVAVPIDEMRVITNISSGNTGFAIALEAARQGFEVTLLMGRGDVVFPKRLPARLEIVGFRFYDELYLEMETRITSGDYGTLIHAAAVSDYKPRQVHQGKISSDKDNLTIELERTVKIVEMVKIWNPKIRLISFKLQSGASYGELIAAAHRSLCRSNADWVVANDLAGMRGGGHVAYIINRGRRIIECNGNNDIAANLIDIVIKI